MSFDFYHVAMLNTLGIAIITNAFQSAAYYLTHSAHGYNFHKKCTLRTPQKSLAFVVGTGLDIVIDAYRLPYNPDELRKGFFCAINHREYIE